MTEPPSILKCQILQTLSRERWNSILRALMAGVRRRGKRLKYETRWEPQMQILYFLASTPRPLAIQFFATCRARFLIMCSSTLGQSSDFRLVAPPQRDFCEPIFLPDLKSRRDKQGLICLCLSSNRQCMMCLGGPQLAFVPHKRFIAKHDGSSGGRHSFCFSQREEFKEERNCEAKGTSEVAWLWGHPWLKGLPPNRHWLRWTGHRSPDIRPSNSESLGPLLFKRILEGSRSLFKICT